MVDALDPRAMISERLFGWTPFRASMTGPRMQVDWCHLGGGRMVEPFFFETIVNAMRLPFNLAFQQRTALADLAGLPPGIAPSGFIFHMSRCGSTLMSQSLAAHEANIVVSEAQPLRAVLQARAHGLISQDEADQGLAGLVNALAQQRFIYERQFFIKFMAADVLFLKDIRRVFPNTPWIFAYRDPVEILASQKTQSGIDLMPGHLPRGMIDTPGDPHSMDPIAYQSHVLAAFGQAALDNQEAGKSLFLNYNELPGALIDKMPAHFGFRYSPEGESLIRAVAMRNAKKPREAFAGDSEAKQHMGAEWRATVDAIAGPVIAALDKARG